MQPGWPSYASGPIKNDEFRCSERDWIHYCAASVIQLRCRMTKSALNVELTEYGKRQRCQGMHVVVVVCMLMFCFSYSPIRGIPAWHMDKLIRYLLGDHLDY